MGVTKVACAQKVVTELREIVRVIGLHKDMFG